MHPVFLVTATRGDCLRLIARPRASSTFGTTTSCVAARDIPICGENVCEALGAAYPGDEQWHGLWHGRRFGLGGKICCVIGGYAKDSGKSINSHDGCDKWR